MFDCLFFFKEKIERSFTGIITGLVFNGIRILDLAAERDPRIQLRGELELLTSIPADYRQRFKENNHQSMQRAPESSYASDDLVYSGAGSGCPSSSADDECVPTYSSGRGGNQIIFLYFTTSKKFNSSFTAYLFYKHVHCYIKKG